MKSLILNLIASLVVAAGLAGVGQAQECNCCNNGNRALSLRRGEACPQDALSHPWHYNYYHAAWGSPVALVVPPTAERQYNLGWGVANSRLTRICHQFGRAHPGEVVDGEGRRFLATPRWPSDTSQFGVYYVRGPW
ncbi:MAG: hypothetical protein VB875_14775 [Pirellulales bacterium]